MLVNVKGCFRARKNELKVLFSQHMKKKKKKKTKLPGSTVVNTNKGVKGEELEKRGKKVATQLITLCNIAKKHNKTKLPMTTGSI